MSAHQLTPLSELDGDGQGVVRQIGGHRGSISRLSALGFTLGAEVSMLRNPRNGPLVVVVRDTRVALARDVAVQIFVQTGLPDGSS